MKKKRLIHISLLSSIFLLISILIRCHRTTIVANEIYNNQFYLEIDGHPATPFIHNTVPVQIYLLDSVLHIKAIHEDKHKGVEPFSLMIHIEHFHGPGTYPLEDISQGIAPGQTFARYIIPRTGELVTGGGPNDYIRILEMEGQHISGIFRFDVANDSVWRHIDKGFFDWNEIHYDE